jgi:hypothetical protein
LLFTLGYSEPEGAAPAAVVFAAASTGLVIVALQIAYLPTLYAAFNRRETEVARLNSRPGYRRGAQSCSSARPAQSPCAQALVRAKVQHMEEGYTQLGTVLIDERPEDSEADGVIVVGRFKGGPYDGVQLSYDAGRRNLYLTPEGALRLAFLLTAAVERDVDIR